MRFLALAFAVVACAKRAPTSAPGERPVVKADASLRADAVATSTPIDAVHADAPLEAAVTIPVDAGIAAVSADAGPPPHFAPIRPPRPPVHVPFKMSDRDEDAEKRCRRALKTCKHVFAELEAPPSPCAGQGTRCIQPIPQPTDWLCHCDQCQTDSDCGEGNYCTAATLSGCFSQRTAATCEHGPRPAPTPCPNVGPSPAGLRPQPGGPAR